MHTDTDVMYKHNYEIWQRTGGLLPAITNLRGLEASVPELNTLVGINTEDTVQDQLDTKANSADLGTISTQDADNVAIIGGTIETTTISNSTITIPIGTSVLSGFLASQINEDMVAVGNIGVGEDDLITYSMPASVLSEDGDTLDITAFGTVAANANNKTIKLYFGSTVLIDTGAVAANSGSWYINSKIARISVTSEKAITEIISDNLLIIDSASFKSPTADTAAAIEIKCTGEATSDNDIVQEGLIIKWFKA